MATDFSKYGTSIKSTTNSPKSTDFSKYGTPTSGDSTVAAQQVAPDSGSTSAFLKPVGELAVLPQLAQKAVASVITTPSRNKINENQSNIGNIVSSFLSKAHSETDPVKKSQYLAEAQKSVDDLKRSGANVADLEQQIQEANKINVPIPVVGGTISAISNEPSSAIQQIAGRSIGTIAALAPTQLGSTLAGASFGLGESLEQKNGLADTAKNVGLYALGGKLLDYGFGKIAQTGLGKRILTSPAAQIAGKVLSPFTAEDATTPAGIAVDTIAKKAGDITNKAFSPSTYLKPIGNVLSKAGQAVGLVKNEQQALEAAHNKIQGYWNDAKNRYASTIKYDTDSPAVLAREGIIPRAKGGSMLTNDESELLRIKTSAEKQTFNKMLESANLYPSIDSYKRDAMQLINNNFKGIERNQAIAHMERQFNALERNYAEKIITRPDGERVLPGVDANEIKSYLWSQGYASKLGPKSDAIAAETSRLMGNAVKNEIQNAAEQQAGAETKDAIISLNNRLGELYQAQKFLDSMNGKKLPYGQIGRHFARVAGAVMGAQGGVAGSITGALTAEKLVDILQDPKFSVGQAAAIIARARTEAPQALKQAEQIISQNLQRQANTLALPSPRPLGSPENPIIAGAPATIEPQAAQINYSNTVKAPVLPPRPKSAPVNELRDVYNDLVKAGMTKERALEEIVPKQVIDSIKKGTIDPIILDKEGNIVDGLHRALAGEVLGIEIPQYVQGSVTKTNALFKKKVLPAKDNGLIKEAKKYKSAEEFASHYIQNPKEIPTTLEYQNFLKEKDTFVKRENEIYAEMKALRSKYIDKTINEVPSSDIAKYESLKKELEQTLSKNTLAKIPEGVIKTHIGEKGLRSQLEEIWKKANK